VILLQAGVIGNIVLKSGSGYNVASAPEVQVKSVDLYVNFVPSATAEEVTKFLRAHQGSIVEGPKGPGTYLVRFAASGTPKDETQRLIKEMQQNRTVVSSEFEASEPK
jgi:hypothetical protein